MPAQYIEILSAARGFDADESHAKDVMRSQFHAVNIIHFFTSSVSFITMGFPLEIWEGSGTQIKEGKKRDYIIRLHSITILA
ncbi:MAG: hypothetical protein ABSC14_06345 [Desulfomonilia bacterium]|jgi:hypothetical protein